MDDPTNKVQVIEARTPEQALQLLTAGRAPLLLQYALPMEQALAAHPTPDLKSTLISPVWTVTSSCRLSVPTPLHLSASWMPASIS
jgi:hypothetical protein